MGKIMMNGIQYGVGGIEQAKDISYDNTESGATATDVQGALDELNAGLSNIGKYTQENSVYKTYQQISGQITLPKPITEINTFLIVFGGSNNISRATATIPACYILAYPTQAHQANVYVSGRSYISLTYADATHLTLGGSIGGDYIDRVTIYWD